MSWFLTRSGPYSGAILRFSIRFPALYPAVPPLVTFSTDIFHPLLAPLTVQLYTSSEDDSTGFIILDDERLPPGGFSLRHGFPSWFKRSRSLQGSSQGTGSIKSPKNVVGGPASPKTPVQSLKEAETTKSSPASSASAGGWSPDSAASRSMRDSSDMTTFEVLRYIRSTFDDASVLDDVPLEAAGNTGAWRAWKAHRTQDSHATQLKKSQSGSKGQRLLSIGSLPRSPVKTAPRQPGEWNWDGVWLLRVKKGIDLSVSEASLYGNTMGPDELVSISMSFFVCGELTRQINFVPADAEALSSVNEEMKQRVKDV